jgi:NAD(P)H-dependent FMN reductase
MKLIGISGSLRKGSFNTALLRAAATVMPQGTSLDIASIAGFPLYDGDLEAEHGLPTPVVALKEKIAACDGLVLATPEYNNSMPGVLKNAVDWLSRPANEIAHVFGDRPVALMGATPGRSGTTLAQAAWLPVLRSLRTRPWFGGRLLVSGARQVFNDEGELVDDKVRERLTEFMDGFARFAAGR